MGTRMVGMRRHSQSTMETHFVRYMGALFLLFSHVRGLFFHVGGLFCLYGGRFLGLPLRKFLRARPCFYLYANIVNLKTRSR